jgi:PadR family transcriptional regulator PadR
MPLVLREWLTKGSYLPINGDMRRKPGVLLPIEVEILEVSAARGGSDGAWLHGYGLAKLLREERGSKRLTAHGTLYKALSRLADGGLLDHQWEHPDAGLEEGRPRRRLYRINGLGQKALADAHTQVAARTVPPAAGMAPA